MRRYVEGDVRGCVREVGGEFAAKDDGAVGFSVRDWSALKIPFKSVLNDTMEGFIAHYLGHLNREMMI